MENNKHIVLFRSSTNVVNINTYNCQELGLAKALVLKGWKVSIIWAGNEYKHSIFQFEEHIINIYYMPFRRVNKSISWFKGYGTLLKKLNPNVIQVQGFGLLMPYLAIRWAKKNNVKCVLIQGNYSETQKPILKQLEQLFSVTIGRYNLKHVDGVGSKTLMAGEFVKGYYNRDVHLTRIGLDDSNFRSPQVVIRNWREELDITNKKILLYIGQLEPRRNPVHLLNILKQLPSDYVLLMVGSGIQEAQTKTISVELNLTDRCFFLGKLKQEELPAIYKSADLFLLASNYEIYGMVILEAMYFGLPVVTTLTAGSETIVSNGEDGVIIDNLDTDKWCYEIRNILEGGKLDTMKANAINKINTTLLWEKAVDQFIELYES